LSATPTGPEPRRSFLTIPRLGLRDYPVIRYRGSPDDAEGTRLQNDGSLASPRGATGGTAPGEIGNYIVTGHRLSSTEPFRRLPSLPQGSRVWIRVADVVHVYEVRRTRWTSFRSRKSLAAQRAPVPGRPGVEATRPMITLSTCATIEDHAAGNYWADEFDNPEHRIDKIGVLVTTRPA
jgi:sortase A